MRTRLASLLILLAWSSPVLADDPPKPETKVYPGNMALVGAHIGTAVTTAGWGRVFRGVSDRVIDAWSAAEKRGSTSNDEWVSYDKGRRPLLDFAPDAWGQFQRLDGKKVVSERTIRIDPSGGTANVSVMEFDGPRSEGIVLTPSRWTYLTLGPRRVHLLERSTRKTDGAVLETQLEGREIRRVGRSALVLERRQATEDLGEQHRVKIGYKLRLGSRAFIPLPRFLGHRLEQRLDRRAATNRSR